MTVVIGTGTAGAAGAVPRGRRIEVLDVLRGVAILGTLGTNVWIFTDPRGPAGVLVTPAQGSFETLLRILSNGKFLTLLTVLFGMGLELQYRSARRRGRRWPGWYLWRAALLFGEGLLHYLLIFEWDVLMAYALVSMVVAGVVARSDRAVRTWMITAGVLHVAVVGLLTLDGAGTGTGASSGDGTGGLPGGDDLYRTDEYLRQVALRIEWAGVFRSEMVFVIPLTIMLFLLGSRLLRAGGLERSARGGRVRARLAVLGLGVGLPLNLVTSFAGPRWFFVDRYLCGPLVAFGLLAFVVTVVYRMPQAPGRVRRALTAVGRTALSCYVLQNLLCAVLCYGWGLGLAGLLAGYRPWWVPGAWLVVGAALTLAATAWLRRFDRGPLELAWHWAWELPQRSRG